MKIKKRDEDELEEKLNCLTLNDSSEDEKQVKKIKKKYSFINDSSSSEEDDNDPEYIPKTRASKKKALKKDKITP